MKALVLSGGKGTRLRPLTHTIAKQLVPVAGKPILGYVLGHIANSGITQVGIIISPETGAFIRDYIGDGSKWGIKPEFILQQYPQGLAHAVLIARDFLKDDDFVMYLGDNLLGHGVKEAIERFNRNRPDALIFLKEVADPKRFGVAVQDEQGNIVQLIEKPANPPSNLALVGVYIFSNTIFQAIALINPSQRGELEITDAIQKLIDMGRRVESEIITGWWLDTGKKDDLLEANTIVLDEYVKHEVKGDVDGTSKLSGRVSIEEGAKIINSRIRGPVRVGNHSIIENSFIGPFTSIGSNVVIKDSAIEHSVILQGCTISGINKLEDSLLGRDCKVLKSSSQPEALRLTISDDSVVEV